MRKLSKNLLSLFMSDVVSRLLGFIAIAYIARLLGIEGLGQIRYGFAFLNYALLFANPGLTTIGAREIAKDIHNRRIIDEVMGLRIFLSGLIFLFFIIGLFLVPGQTNTKNIILLYVLSLIPFAFLMEFVLQGREEMEYIGISRLIQYGLYIVFLLVFLRSTKDILMVPVSFLIGYAAAAGFLFSIFLKKYRILTPKFSLYHWHRLLMVSIPVGLATIFNQVSVNLPPITLGVFHSKTEVGAFSASFAIIVMLLIVERVFYYVFFPVLSRQFVHEPKKLTGSFTILTRLLFSITIPLTVGGMLVAPQLIYLIYGAGYESSIAIFRILLLYFLIAPVTTIFGYGLVAINQERRFFKVITITGIINFLFIILLGLNFRGLGAAAAFCMSELIAVVFMKRELKKFVSFEVIQYVRKPVVAAFVMAVVLLLFRDWHVIALVAVGIFVYILILYVIKGFSKEEIKKLKRAV
ncbi:MAG: flippase [candidate division WOR-3 bacterium]|nr:MAG: flippase [candidate division WOR-3 bacterium]